MQDSLFLTLLESFILMLINIYSTFIDIILTVIPLDTFVPIFPWADFFAILFPALALILIVDFLLSRGERAEMEPVSILSSVLNGIATKENRDHLLDVIESGAQGYNQKLEEKWSDKSLSPVTYTALKEAVSENHRTLHRILNPFASSTDELQTEVDNLRERREQLESEIATMQERLKSKPAPAVAPGAEAPAPSVVELKAAMDKPVEGDQLVTDMLAQIKSITHEFDLKSALKEMEEE